MQHVTHVDLMAALPHVLAAPKTDAAIETLCFRSDFGQRDFRTSLTLTKEHGIPGERWLKHPWLKLANGEPDPRIQISLLPTRVMDLVWRDRDSVVHPGDPIVADLDMSDDNTPPGTLIRAGTAILRVSDMPNDGCVKWKARYGQAAMDWIADPALGRLRLRGVLCSIEQDGVVTLTDRLQVLR
jgi:hypothetical protein